MRSNGTLAVMRRISCAIGLGIVAAVTPATATATIIFTDNFDANAAALNLTPAGWTATGGTVDVVGTGLFSELCAGGPSPSRCIDLDGSSGAAANLHQSIAVPTSGSYVLSFWLQANDRGFGGDTVNVSFGTYAEGFTLVSLGNNLDSWALYQRSVFFAAPGSFDLSFDHTGSSGDFRGILLDNVQVEAVPEPGTMMLLGSGIVGLALRRRRRAGA